MKLGKEGLKEFSIMAQNSRGEDTIGISANDRITKYNTMMSAGNFPRVHLHEQSTGGVGWPMILAVVITLIGVCLIGAVIYYFQTKRGLSWTICTRKEKDS